MNELRNAIAINNQIVSRACIRNDSAGISANVALFQRAIQAMKRFTDHFNSVFGAYSHSAPNDHFSSIGFHFERNVVGILAGCESEYGLIYNRPLFLPTDIRTASFEDLETVGFIVSTSVIFNLALAWHELGRMTGRENALTKAGKLYELVVLALGQAGTDDDPSHGVLKYLALNNHAQILHSLGEFEKSQHRVYSMIDQLRMDDNLDILLGGSEAKTYRLNVMYFNTPCIALAA